jgi:hypothetical protein
MSQGLVLLRQRTLGELISDSLGITRAYWKPLAIMTAPAVVIDLVLTIMAQQAAETAAFLVSVLSLPVQIIAFQLVTGAVAVALMGLAGGKMLTPNEALDTASDKLWRMVSATVRAGIIVLLWCLTIVGIPLGIIRAVRWAFVSQAVMLDPEQPDLRWPTARRWSSAMAGRPSAVCL